VGHLLDLQSVQHQWTTFLYEIRSNQFEAAFVTFLVFYFSSSVFRFQIPFILSLVGYRLFFIVSLLILLAPYCISFANGANAYQTFNIQQNNPGRIDQYSGLTFWMKAQTNDALSRYELLYFTFCC
jgi:uncharacterized membrane protein (UPF0182 family)